MSSDSLMIKQVLGLKVNLMTLGLLAGASSSTTSSSLLHLTHPNSCKRVHI